MGLLDKIKPHVASVRPTDVAAAPDGGVQVRWDDGKESLFPAKWLRARCPCAGCVEEWSGRRTVSEAQIKADVRVHNLEPGAGKAGATTGAAGPTPAASPGETSPGGAAGR